MGETEGKKDEADYKRLQTFPLVRVRPGGGGQVAGKAQEPWRERGKGELIPAG